jgi:hypothetical protein
MLKKYQSSLSCWLRWVAVGFALALVALSALVAASREDVVYNKYGVKVTLQRSKEGAEDPQIVLKKKSGRSLQQAVPLGRFTAEGQRLIHKLGLEGPR